MFIKLFLAFTLIPLAEIYLLLEIGSSIGILPTIAVVVVTAFAGASLARMQGAHTMHQVRTKLHEGQMPAEELVDTLLIFVAGIVLLTPGFITDLTGLLILFPPTRLFFKRYLKRRFKNWIGGRVVNVEFHREE